MCRADVLNHRMMCHVPYRGGHKTVGGLPFCSCLKIQASTSIKVRKVWVMGEYKVSGSFVTFVCTTFGLLLLKLD